MALVSLFGLVELIFSQLSDSLALLLDSFHSLSVLLDLAMPVLAEWLGRRPIPSSHTFAWERLAPVGSLMADVLSLSLCCSVSVAAMARFLNPHPFHRPPLPIAAGTAGIFLNLGVHLWLRSTGSGWSYGPCPESRQCHLDTTGGYQCPKDKGRDATDGLSVEEQLAEAVVADPLGTSFDGAGPRWRLARDAEHVLILSNPCLGLPSEEGHCSSPFLHPVDLGIRRQLEEGSYSADSTGQGSEPAVAGHTRDREPCSKRVSLTGWMEIFIFPVGLTQSVLSSAVALVVGLFHSFPAQTGSWHRDCLPYLDPGLSLLTVLALVAGAAPRLKASVLLLLECVPAQVDLRRLTDRLTSVRGVIAVHELHVWRLSMRRVLASAHVQCRSPRGFARVAEDLRRVLGSEGVHSATLQPEFVGPAGGGGSKGMTRCQLACGPHCAKRLCCDWPKGA
ncbi:proton-coupled zinc antiporter SLC30A1-like [Heterodontus francisci]|uniref:proton-coupled zinc antiporter SLC30A1-like n=1 Tax=Heterodontus francisci TaxID=7792 RepID=UPI00355B07D0